MMKVVLKFGAVCPVCEEWIPEGKTALWDHRFGVEMCLACHRKGKEGSMTKLWKKLDKTKTTE